MMKIFVENLTNHHQRHSNIIDVTDVNLTLSKFYKNESRGENDTITR